MTCVGDGGAGGAGGAAGVGGEGGSGGVGIEGSTPTSHFVTFAGLLEAATEETMNRLRQTLDLKNQPQMILYAIQPREANE